VEHTTPTNTNPVERLERLAAQRTVRTDRLHQAMVVLFCRLRELMPVGTCVTAGDVSLYLCRHKSNVSSDVAWSVTVGPQDDPRHHCNDLERPVGFDGFLHGDFHCPITGPSRGLLIAVGRAAPALVAELIATTARTNARLDEAQASVDAASQALAGSAG
jgi:hypothetical protein